MKIFTLLINNILLKNGHYKNDSYKSIFFNSLFFNSGLAIALISPYGFATTEPNNDVTLSEISWIDAKYFEKKRTIIDNLGRENYGTRLRGNIKDIQLMQRLLDGQKTTIFETDIHRAFGVVLGDIYVAEKGWQWFEYKDKQGRSRAVCLPKTTHCVFPLSMMTRRLRVSTQHDVARIYQKGLDLMAQVTPQLPYSAEKEAPKPIKRDRNQIVVPF